MDIHNTQVNLTGLLDVLGSALYSTPNVAIRELVQNAHDSCTRRRLEAADDFAPRIDVSVDAAARTLTIEDTGAGLTESEVADYLATVGVGYTRTLRERSGSTDLIGRFGLGFLSVYVVASRVEVWTTSWQSPGIGCRFVSNGGERYQLTAAPPRPVGTRVVLSLKPDFEGLADAVNVGRELNRYCALLDVPVHLNHSDEPVNHLEPPWRTDEPEGSARYRRLAQAVVDTFERDFRTLCTLPVGPETGTSDARGLLWIHDAGTYGTSDNRNLSVFVRGMMVCEDARELLPPWAGWLGGVIESDSLSPTASRESLRKDDVHELVREHLAAALLAGLARQPDIDRPTWRRILTRHNEALLGAALAEPPLFGLLADELRLPTTEGDLTVPAILGRSGNRVYVSSGEQRGPEELVFRALRQPVVLGSRYAALAFASTYGERRGVRVAILGTEDGDRDLFRASSLDGEDEALLSSLFEDDDHAVHVAAFEPAALPLLSVVDREALVKARIESDSADARIGRAALGLARLATAGQPARRTRRRYVNARSPLIARLLSLDASRQAELARLLAAFTTAASAPEDLEGGFRLDEHLANFGDALLALIDADDAPAPTDKADP